MIHKPMHVGYEGYMGTVRYLPHAAEAIKKRGLRTEWVARAIETPDWTEADPEHAGRTRSYLGIETLDGRVLRVVHYAEDDEIVVVTAFLDRSARRKRVE